MMCDWGNLGFPHTPLLYFLVGGWDMGNLMFSLSSIFLVEGWFLGKPKVFPNVATLNKNQSKFPLDRNIPQIRSM